MVFILMAPYRVVHMYLDGTIHIVDDVILLSDSLTHWGWDKMATVLRTTFSNVFYWMKIYEFHLRFHWSLFLMVYSTIFQHWFRYWLNANQATSHYLKQWWLDYRCIYASLCVNELKYLAPKKNDLLPSLRRLYVSIVIIIKSFSA